MAGVSGSFLPKFLISVAIISCMTSVYAATPKAYISSHEDRTINVVDLYSDKVTSTIEVPKGSIAMRITADGKMYVTEARAGIVGIINTLNDQVTSSIKVGINPQGLALTKDGKELLVAVEDANNLKFVDTASNKIVASIMIPGVYAVAINDAGNMAVTASQFVHQFALQVIDVATKKIIHKVTVQNAPQVLRFGPDNNYFYFTAAGLDAIAVLNAKDFSFVKYIPTASVPRALAFTHDGKLGLSASRQANMLYVFDPKTNVILDKIPVGKEPYSIAVSEDDKVAYVTNEGSNTVSVVDLAGKRTLKTIFVGNSPHKIVLQSRDIPILPAPTI